MEKKIDSFVSKESLYSYLSNKYKVVLDRIFANGCYIWGTGKLGQFAYEQLKKNNIEIKGFIDNATEKQGEYKKVYAPAILDKQCNVVIASFYYPDIIEQLESKNIYNYIYYEEFAQIIEGMSVYYPAFINMYEELVENIREYNDVYNLLEDNISMQVFSNILKFRSTMDIKYSKQAYELSRKEGNQDLDKLVTCKLNEEYTYFDVGGFDGQSTLDYIECLKSYKRIYFFEPDKNVIKLAQKRLKGKKNIVYVQAGVGEKSEKKKYNAKGNGAGSFLDLESESVESVEMVALDDYVNTSETYIKMDVEGYELKALMGTRESIKKYHPILSISVYHLPGDIHKLIKLILNWYPHYKVYMRHYAKNYADTRIYFIS